MSKFTLRDKLPGPSYQLDPDSIIYNWNSVESTPAVYVFVDSKGTYLYCGKTANLRSRLKTHYSGSHNSEIMHAIRNKLVSYILIFECETDLDATILERYFIQSGLYRGLYNTQFISEPLTSMPEPEAKYDDTNDFPVGSIESIIYELGQEIEHVIPDWNKIYKAFQGCALRLMKRRKDLSLMWDVYQHDYGYLLSDEAKDRIAAILSHKRHKKKLLDSYEIEVITFKGRKKIHYKGYVNYLSKAFDELGHKQYDLIISQEEFIEQLSV